MLFLQSLTILKASVNKTRAFKVGLRRAGDEIRMPPATALKALDE